MPVHKFIEETGEKLEKHELCITQLQKDVDELKRNDREQLSSLTDLERWRMQHEKNFNELKETISKENEQTRETMLKQTDTLTTQNTELLDLVKTTLGVKSSTDKYAHDLKMLKWDRITTIILKAGGGLIALLGSGTGLYLVIEYFFGK